MADVGDSPDPGPQRSAAAAQQLFGDRYEIERRIGRGGMADVFLARDRQLDRPVAVKVLFPEFSRDAAFVERFRREAQSAANLSHRHIVAVYDWGERDDTYFIVMEYVEGRTLAEILRSEGPLQPDRAAEVAADVAGALAYAHRNGVIHRDVKPGNVLITPGGQAKVADFGIAQPVDRPAQDLTVAGAVIGTAAYFSPEQAQGRPLDPRSDLYALGCVLYETLTGRPPFVGDNPMAIAYQHVSAEPAPPSAVGVGVPAALDAICMRLLAKEPAGRYASSEDARADLRRFRDGKAVHAAPPVGAGPPEAIELEGELVEAPPRRVGTLVVSLVVLLAVLGGLLTLLVDALGQDDEALATEAVPSVVNMEVGAARDALSEAGFIPVTQFEENDDFDEDVVFDQNPPRGTKLELGSEVVLRVSSGGSTVPVPQVVGLQSTQARSMLESSGLVVEEAEEFHEVAAIGEVIRQDPPARQDVPPGSRVTITVSTGPEPIELPDLKGRSELEAANTLGNLGFEVAFFDEESEDVDEGKVVRTDPPAGEKLAPGGTVTVVLSTGKFIDVPSVVGLTSDEAVAVLQGANLQPSIEIQPLPAEHPDDGKVVAQTPEAGAKAEKGSVVVIRVGVAAVAPPTTSTTTTTRPTTTVPVVIDTFTLEPNTMPTDYTLLGAPKLTWSVSGGATVTVTGPGVDKEGPSGTARVCPGTVTDGYCSAQPGSYTYTLTVLNEAGNEVVSRSLTLVITA